MLEQRSRLTGLSWHLAVECKRGNPDFKTWLFFNAQSPLPSDQTRYLYIQAGSITSRVDDRGRQMHMRRIHRFPIPAALKFEIFNCYVESRESAPGRDKQSSSTKAIEDSFYQVTLGGTALANTLVSLQEPNFRVMPVVVTTAELFAADFEVGRVSLERGELAPGDLSLRPLDWLAVNYSVSDKVATHAQLTSARGRTIEDEMISHLLRTVFVVRAAKLSEFLVSLNDVVDSCPP